MPLSGPDPYQEQYERQKQSPDFGRPTFGSNPPPSQQPQSQGQTPQFSTPAEQAAYQAGQRDTLRRQSVPRMTGWRVACGICWALWTLLLFIGGISLLSQGNAAGLLSFVLAGLAAWYDVRIWTLKARYLSILIIF